MTSIGAAVHGSGRGNISLRCRISLAAIETDAWWWAMPLRAAHLRGVYGIVRFPPAAPVTVPGY